jgi:hypothetical protein
VARYELWERRPGGRWEVSYTSGDLELVNLQIKRAQQRHSGYRYSGGPVEFKICRLGDWPDARTEPDAVVA